MSDDMRNLILDVYDTVADPSLWQGVLDKFAAALDAKGFVIFELHGYGNERELSASHFSSYHQRDLLQGYIDEYRHWELIDQDTFEAHSLASDGIDLIDDSVLARSDDELFQIPNVAQLLDYGIRHRHAGLLNKDNKTRSRFSVQLASDRGRLTPVERERMREVLPHIAKALDLGQPSKQHVLNCLNRLSQAPKPEAALAPLRLRLPVPGNSETRVCTNPRVAVLWWYRVPP